jgi:hypothetical protein
MNRIYNPDDPLWLRRTKIVLFMPMILIIFPFHFLWNSGKVFIRMIVESSEDLIELWQRTEEERNEDHNCGEPKYYALQCGCERYQGKQDSHH